MKPRILIATGNAGKQKEMLEVLGDLPAEFVSLADLGLKNTVDESGGTYLENAYLKADHFFRMTGLPTIAEDSGLEVNALRGELGIKTRRWGAGENATDAEWLAFFLNRLQTVTDRGAAFHCTAVVVAPGLRESFVGTTSGQLATEPRSEIPHGIPVSAVFVPDGHALVYAAMSPAEKNAVSHRGKAMHQLKAFLRQKLV